MYGEDQVDQPCEK